ncbi:MAG: cupin domain-containing protein [Planctomycetota bacterium]
MKRFDTLPLPAQPTIVAPDGSDVRVLLQLSGGSMAHFELAAGRVSAAIKHRTVEEIWYILSGEGIMWRKLDESEEIVTLAPGICLTIPLGTHFQFRASSQSALTAVGITMPPWPGADEAIPVSAKWEDRSSDN